MREVLAMAAAAPKVGAAAQAGWTGEGEELPIAVFRIGEALAPGGAPTAVAPQEEEVGTAPSAAVSVMAHPNAGRASGGAPAVPVPAAWAPVEALAEAADLAVAVGADNRGSSRP